MKTGAKQIWSRDARRRALRPFGRVAALALVLLVARIPSVRAQEAVCARVVIEIRQELTLERQAFDAHMRINNGTASALQNVDIDLIFTDENGQPEIGTSDTGNSAASFFVRLDETENIDNVNGSGTVEAGKTADIHWLLIPTIGAGGTQPDGKRHFVGARLRYVVGGEDNVADVVPDSIVVKPLPKLTLDYFLPQWVYGDDAFTETIEAPVPFDLGVRVKNTGFGAAHSVKISSSQPQIVDNERGLLIGFEITGSFVNDHPATESLLVDFGDIAPSKAAVAGWIMKCSLSGKFVELKSRFTHSDDLGGQLTSLLDAVNSHLLIHKVHMDLTGRDALADFLALDGTNTIKLYESDTIDTVVTNVSNSATWDLVSSAGTESKYRLYVTPSAGPLYVKKGFSGGSDKEVRKVVRSIDGKIVNLSNAWIAKEKNKDDPTQWDYYFSLFDANGGGEYIVTLKQQELLQNLPPVLHYIGNKVVLAGGQLGFLVAASDPNGTIPAMGVVGLPSGASYTNDQPGKGSFFWRPEEADWGVHPVRFTASDGQFTARETIRIYVGHAGEGLDQNGIPLSLKDWKPRIQEIVASADSGNATVQWAGTEGVLYEVFYSDNPFSSGSAWVKLGTTLEGTGTVEKAADSGIAQKTRRYYQVVLEGDAPSTNGVWGVINKTLPAGYTMVAPPLRSDRRFDGELGAQLAEQLLGDSGGVGDSLGDEVYVLEPSGNWRMLYLDENGVWRESNGQISTYEIPAGRGFWVARNEASSVKATFAGPVGNDGTQTVSVYPGWNMIGISEGRDLTLAQAFPKSGPNAPTGGASEDSADLIAVMSASGAWRRMFYVQGWGAPYDGKWFDLSTFEISNYAFQPGDAVYYFRRSQTSTMQIPF